MLRHRLPIGRRRYVCLSVKLCLKNPKSFLDTVSTGSGSMKGLSRKKFSSCRQQFLAASHATYREPFKLSHEALVPGVQRTSKPLQLTHPSPCRPFLFLLLVLPFA